LWGGAGSSLAWVLSYYLRALSLVRHCRLGSSFLFAWLRFLDGLMRIQVSADAALGTRCYSRDVSETFSAKRNGRDYRAGVSDALTLVAPVYCGEDGMRSFWRQRGRISTRGEAVRLFGDDVPDDACAGFRIAARAPACRPNRSGVRPLSEPKD
jgi:hypothetical protein